MMLTKMILFVLVTAFGIHAAQDDGNLPTAILVKESVGVSSMQYDPVDGLYVRISHEKLQGIFKTLYGQDWYNGVHSRQDDVYYMHVNAFNATPTHYLCLCRNHSDESKCYWQFYATGEWRGADRHDPNVGKRVRGRGHVPIYQTRWYTPEQAYAGPPAIFQSSVGGSAFLKTEVLSRETMASPAVTIGDLEQYQETLAIQLEGRFSDEINALISDVTVALLSKKRQARQLAPPGQAAAPQPKPELGDEKSNEAKEDGEPDEAQDGLQARNAALEAQVAEMQAMMLRMQMQMQQQPGAKLQNDQYANEGQKSPKA